MPFTLHYFSLAGRAEVARLLLHTATKKVEWVDKRHEFADWQAVKPSTTFRQLPALQLEDGSFLAQSSAIDRYLAVKTGAEPKDELAWARSDEVYAFLEDLWMTLAPTMRIKDEVEKLAARKAACEGPLREKLDLLDAHLAKLGNDAWFSGLDRPSYADFAIFNWMSVLKCGWLDGIPETIWAGHTNIVAFHARVAALDGVKSWYALPENQDENRQKGAAPVVAA